MGQGSREDFGGKGSADSKGHFGSTGRVVPFSLRQREGVEIKYRHMGVAQKTGTKMEPW